ncbi:MAG: hypothetical protein GC191_02025 [Azospirillum sp.]|nr:hypothetical protein [Azospirillum sp.]
MAPHGDERGTGQDLVPEAGLVNRNVTVNGRRTSIRLEPQMWDALHDICQREGMTVHQICTLVEERRRRRGGSLTAAIRVFILAYFRQAATQEGHARAGHGSGLLVQLATVHRSDGQSDREAPSAPAMATRPLPPPSPEPIS